MKVKGHGILGRPGLSAVCPGSPPKGQSAFSWSGVSRVPWSLAKGGEAGWCRTWVLVCEGHHPRSGSSPGEWEV